jgi:hypothetical protein
MPWRRSSFDNRCRPAIRSPRQSSRARTKSRAASCSTLGIVTATISPRCSNRAKCRASRASVLTPSPEGRCSFEGAATTQSIPAASRNRAKAKPVGPASYITVAGPGSDPIHARISSRLGVNRRSKSSPVCLSSPHATTRSCVHIQPDTRTLKIRWGLPHLVALRQDQLPDGNPRLHLNEAPAPHTNLCNWR